MDPNAHSENSADDIMSQTAIQPKTDWYQTDSRVVAVVLLKNAKEDDVHISFDESAVTFKACTCGQLYALTLALYHSILPEQSTWKVLSSKIEMKMEKAECIKWPTLEKSISLKVDVKQHVASASSEADGKNYPSSSHNRKDWDKIVVDIKREEEEEKPEGDAALQQLFQKIYAEGSDEVRKAMNKSFLESGGTVLSTNWNDVGNKKIDVKPPDGMEWKSWQP